MAILRRLPTMFHPNQPEPWFYWREDVDVLDVDQMEYASWCTDDRVVDGGHIDHASSAASMRSVSATSSTLGSAQGGSDQVLSDLRPGNLARLREAVDRQ